MATHFYVLGKYVYNKDGQPLLVDTGIASERETNDPWLMAKWQVLQGPMTQQEAAAQAARLRRNAQPV